jgi:uncharacterized caspase-like protein
LSLIAHRWVAFVVLLGVLGCGGPGLAQAQNAPDATAGIRRAVLIGINDYKGVPRLQGSVNDVQTLREVLRTRWGFTDDHILLLSDAQATRSGILAALNELVQESGPEDTVYVHFSGHGSQVEDTNGDETDGLDETIVPQDGRTPGVADITDDELDALFARLRARSALLVLDSCHSGTATRSLEIRTRSVPPDTRTDLYRTVSAVQTRALVPLVRSRFLVMGAAASNQEALDGPIEGRYHGFFSYALARSIANSAPNANARDVFAGVARELSRIQQQFGRASMPEPQLEGPPALFDQPLLIAAGPKGSATVTRVAWLPVTPQSAARVILGRGVLLGAATGSRWAIFPPGEIRFAPGTALAVATVVQRLSDDALAILPPGTPAIPAGARAVLQLPPPAAASFAVRLGELPAAMRARLQQIFSHDIVNVSLVDADQPARYVMDMQGERLRLSTADGLQIVQEFPAESPGIGAALAQEFARNSAANDLLSLDNPNSALRLQAQVVTHPTLATRGLTVVADAAPAAYHTRRSGEPRSESNSLQLEISVDRDAYLTIVSVDSQGNTNLLFPNNYTRAGFYPEGRVRGGEPVRIPDTLSAGNRAGFFWDYSPPTGTDTIRVFASTDSETSRLLRARVQALPSPGARTLDAPEAGASAGMSADALRDQLSGMATRSIRLVQDAGAADNTVAVSPDWVAATVTVALSD